MASRGLDKLNKLADELKKKYLNSKIIAHKCDFTEERDLEALKNLIEEKFGGIDIVVANVGDGRSVNDVMPSKEQWDMTWNINFNSALFTARTFLPLLESSNGNLLLLEMFILKEELGIKR